MKSPNDEQKRAIENNGNVILQAGAGSGKTFVIINHIIFKIRKFIESHENLNDDNFEKKMRSFLSKVVVMTFTTKATMEIRERVKSAIEFEVVQWSIKTNNPWDLAFKNLNYLSITTIHGFFFKIISKNYFNLAPSNLKILSEVPLRSKIEKLFKDWVIKYKSKNGSIFNSMILNSESVLNAFYHIFNSAELRLLWEKNSEKMSPDDTFNHFFKKIININELEGLFFEPFDLEIYKDFDDKNWFKYLSSFEDIRIKGIPKNLKMVEEYLSFFEEYKGVRSPLKKLDLLPINERMEKLKRLRKIIKDDYESFNAFLDKGNTSFIFEWYRFLSNIFHYLNDNYHRYEGYGYSDLEYYLIKGLREQELIRKKARKEYEYFIIDEFQDTSEIQFDIIRLILDEKFEKVFCVGDLKQAIYGFRGGDINVFSECKKYLKHKLKLLNNYRSDSNIVCFNNSLFTYVLGQDKALKNHWEGQVAAQGRSLGIIEKINVNITIDKKLNGSKKLSNSEIEYIESTIIFEKILELQLNDSDHEIAILYKKLSSSISLISLLLKNNISFSAQVKIAHHENPVFGIFHLFVEAYIEQQTILKDGGALGDYHDYFNLVIKCYIDHLQINVNFNGEKLINTFFSEVRDYGFFESFKRALFQLNFCGIYADEMKILEECCESTKENSHLLWKELEKISIKKENFEFKSGNNPGKIKILTSHSSKGLEFDSVIIGGIHTNGRVVSDNNFIGKIPGSYRWKGSISQKKAYKSPQLIYENYLIKKKGEGEDKRLFYVTCTRAKKNIFWIDLESDSKKICSFEKSWISYLRSWDRHLKESSELNKFQLTTNYKEFIWDEASFNIGETLNFPPLYQLNSLGLSGKRVFQSNTVLNDNPAGMGVLSEISVTKLSSLIRCPKKFYLENICKLDEEELEILDNLIEVKGEKNNCINLFQNENNRNLSRSPNKSSKERGVMIHSFLERYFSGNYSKNDLYVEDSEYFKFTIDKISFFKKDYDLSFEKLLKFPFFNFMMSGQPDLILVPRKRGKIFRIIDFKTGDRNEENEEVYIFQLYAYAMACFELNLLEKQSGLNIALLYVDAEEIVEFQLGYSDVLDKMTRYLSKLSHLNVTNINHCPLCSFKNICSPQVAQIH